MEEAFKMKRQNLTELKDGIDKSTRIAGDFNTPFLVRGGTSKDGELNTTASLLDLTDPYRQYSEISEHIFLSAYMEHKPMLTII